MVDLRFRSEIPLNSTFFRFKLCLLMCPHNSHANLCLKSLIKNTSQTDFVRWSPPLAGGALMSCAIAAGRRSVTETKSCSVGCRFNCCFRVRSMGGFRGSGAIVGRIWQ